MPQLDNYLVTLGVRGQNLVLAQMDKIRKKGGDLTKKKKTVTLSAKSETPVEDKTAPGKPGVKPDRPAPAPGSTTKRRGVGAPGGVPGPEPLLSEPVKKFSKATDKFSAGTRSFASAASTLDPAATISSVTSAIGTSLSGISVLGVSLGRLPEGIAAIANSTLSMAKNSIDMAKQATAAFHQLTTRNAAAAFYGEKVAKGPMSRNERAMFIDAVSGSMGRIQKPLADEINKLINKKDTRSLARVGAGDWESTGTDKGWMLGQIANSFQGLPPTIKQKLQASLLKTYSGEIQNMARGQRGAQRGAAWFADTEEDQTARIYAGSTGAVKGMVTKFNTMQTTLFNTGIKFAGAINTTISTLNDLAHTIPKVKAALDDLAKNPSLAGVKKAMTAVSGATPRAGK